jgi:ParB-like chromosome segregation protein Spo0J
MVDSYKPHPLAERFPLLSDERFEQLKNSIATQGLQRPVEIYEGMILIGRHRYRACIELGIEPSIIEFTGTIEDARVRVMIENKQWRTESVSQYLACNVNTVREMIEDEKAKAHKRQAVRSNLLPPPVAEVKGEARDIVADQLGVGREYIRILLRVNETMPELLDRYVKTGKRSLSWAMKRVKAEEKKANAQASAAQTESQASASQPEPHPALPSLISFLHEGTVWEFPVTRCAQRCLPGVEVSQGSAFGELFDLLRNDAPQT